MKTDNTIRNEYADLINRLMRDVRPAPEPEPQGARTDEIVRRIEELTRHFDPAALPEVLLMLSELKEHPAPRAASLARLAEAARGLDDGLALTCRAYSLAAEAAREAGDPVAFRTHAKALLELSPNDAWREYAATLLRGLEDAGPGELEHPADCSLFRGLSGPSRAAIGAAARVWRLPVGAWLCVEGSEADEMFVLRTGRVAVLQRLGADDTPLRYRRAGEVVGEMGVLAPDGLRTASMVAVVPTEVWIVPYAVLLELAERPEHADLRERLEEQYFVRRVETRLSQHALFGDLDAATRAELAAIVDASAVPRRFAVGDVLAYSGEPVTHVLLLLDGDLARHLGTRGEEPVAVARTTSTTVRLLGFESMLGPVRWPGDVVAASDGWVAALNARRLRELCNRVPALRAGLAAQLLG